MSAIVAIVVIAVIVVAVVAVVAVVVVNRPEEVPERLGRDEPPLQATIRGTEVDVLVGRRRKECAGGFAKAYRGESSARRKSCAQARRPLTAAAAPKPISAPPVT